MDEWDEAWKDMLLEFVPSKSGSYSKARQLGEEVSFWLMSVVLPAMVVFVLVPAFVITALTLLVILARVL